MNPYDFYISPDDYAAAERIGVSRKLLTKRIRDMAWDKARAISTPPRQKTDRKEWAALAKQNGISYMLFMSRIRKDWTEERAATQPVASEEQIRKNALRASEAARKIPRKYANLAARHGIPYKVFHARIQLGWSYELAATRAIMTPEERGAAGGRRTKELYGNFNALIFKRQKQQQ